MTKRAGTISTMGAVFTAFAASACCLGPLLLAALGLGGAGATSFLGAYRPYGLAATAVLLGVGYYFTYRKPRSAGACGCDPPRPRRSGRVALWIATVAIALLAAAPPLLAALTPAQHEMASNSNLATGILHIPEMDCEGCAAPMRKALSKVGGFHDLRLDLEGRTLTVAYEPAPGRLDAYAAAIRDLGYDTTVQSGSK